MIRDVGIQVLLVAVGALLLDIVDTLLPVRHNLADVGDNQVTTKPPLRLDRVVSGGPPDRPSSLLCRRSLARWTIGPGRPRKASLRVVHVQLFRDVEGRLILDTFSDRAQTEGWSRPPQAILAEQHDAW